MSNYQRVEGVGEAAVFRGDPRLPKQDIDGWFQWILAETKQAAARPHLYGSDAGHCARRNVLLAHNEDMDFEQPATAKAYMALGVAYEDLLAESLKKKDRLIAQGLRIPLMPEVKISGILDLLVFDSDDELAIIEVKTCGKLPDQPKPTHLAQAQIYAAVTGVRKVWLSYFSRNVQLVYGEGLSVRSFAVDTSDEALAKRIETALISDWAAAVNGTPPIPTSFRKHTECHVCEFRDVYCWKPRPGAGGEVQPLPVTLSELSTSEYISLKTKAEAESKNIISNAKERKKDFLKTVLDKMDISFKLYDRVSDEYSLSLIALL